jgi:PAS domain S-box-containing protein
MPTTAERLGQQALDDLVALAALTCGGQAAVLCLDDDGRPVRASYTATPALEATTRMLLALGGAALRRHAGTGSLRVRVIPLATLAGTELGTLAVVLDAPRDLSALQAEALSRLGRQAVALVEQARNAQERRLHVPATQRPGDAEERLRQLVDDVSDVLFEQDTEGRWTFLNAAWKDLLGHEPAACLGHHYVDYLHPDDASASRGRFEALIETGEHQSEQAAARYRTSDGHWRWMEVKVRRVRDAHGRVLGTAGTLRDVTTRRELAEELALAHQQALRSSATMSEFLANMSHEIRTPLNGVLGLTAILLDTPLSDEQRDLASNIRRSAETLHNLVNDILDISKIESGNLTIERVPFELRAWARDVTAPAFARARSKGLSAAVTVHDGLPAQIVGDPTRTQQILTNLLDNAVKFTSAGRVSVDVAACTADDGRRMLRVSVGDTGIGIPADKQGLVFEKYRQADSSTTRRYGGTGLGLAICRQLAAWMDGDVGLESEVGRGSVFWFTIPLAPADVQAAPAEPAPGAAAPATLQVLVVEDSQTNQFVARRFLEMLGCDVELAGNGAEAVARVQAGAFDVVFMDCQMPVMDGYEATSRIRQLECGRHLPIVAMTAHAMAGDREKCLAAGMDDYVSKPLKSEDLLAALRRASREPMPAAV